MGGWEDQNEVPRKFFLRLPAPIVDCPPYRGDKFFGLIFKVSPPVQTPGEMVHFRPPPADQSAHVFLIRCVASSHAAAFSHTSLALMPVSITPTSFGSAVNMSLSPNITFWPPYYMHQFPPIRIEGCFFHSTVPSNSHMFTCRKALLLSPSGRLSHPRVFVRARVYMSTCACE